ncbi:hypothetical protein MMC32_004277 [Xylographa parallela]|nr:hypothetical protein [Xylographa parallela]
MSSSSNPCSTVSGSMADMNAVLLNAEATNASNNNALLISNIGLSALLSATWGFLHEARRARSPSIGRKLEWALVIQYHGAISVALVLIIIGVINLEDRTISTTTSTLLKAAAAILIVCWAALVFWARVSMRKKGKELNTAGYAAGTKSLYGVIAALSLVGLRLIYAIASLLLEGRWLVFGLHDLASGQSVNERRARDDCHYYVRRGGHPHAQYA